MSERKFSLTNYPLTWPQDWKRTDMHRRVRGKFVNFKQQVSIAVGIDRVMRELEMMRIKRDDVLVSTNVPTRLDGTPRSDQREPADPGVAVYWRQKQDAPMKCIAIDLYNRVADNLAAIAATLEAMRAIERYGGAQIQERVFRGFAALPARSGRTWREVLGIMPTAFNIHPDVINEAYRQLAKQMHPDLGGSDGEMAELNAARDAALKEWNDAGAH